MRRRPPRSTRTDTLFPYTTLFRSLDVRRVGDMGALPDSLPVFLLPQVPWTLETLWIVLPVSLTLTVVGLLESLLTAAIVDDLTDTPSNKNRESIGQGKIGRASCRDRVCQYVYIWGVAVALKKKKKKTKNKNYNT